uniref:Uncharacterized protein n=1 Tax=Arundo donax TaxID=35708 RepID=A0A0A9FH07_ARUDO
MQQFVSVDPSFLHTMGQVLGPPSHITLSSADEAVAS